MRPGAGSRRSSTSGRRGRSALPAAAAIGEEFAASEASRGRRHAALLAEVADDAAATARVLAESTALVGGTGRPGDDGRSVAHLAVLLPAGATTSWPPVAPHWPAHSDRVP